MDDNTGSSSCLELGLAWLNECLETHEFCGMFSSETSSKWPKRVIDITDPKSPYLKETDSDPIRYAALSYCWGESKRVVTNSSTYEVFKQKITVEELPKTFQDAIIVSHTLGIFYLWIDAL